MARAPMNPYRKGLAAGGAYWAELAEYNAKSFAERASLQRPIAPANPYPEPVGKRGAALANSGWRQWDDGFRFSKDRR